MNSKYVVIDLETTGHSPANSDKIIEAGIVVIEGDSITEEFSTFLNPNMAIPSFITNLTGITDDDVRHAPIFHDKALEITALFENSYLIAHNVAFDLGFLNEELALHGFSQLNNPVIDTVELARILYPHAPGFKLGQLANFLQIEHNAPHRALTDARVTAELFLKLKEKLQTLPFETITHLLTLEKGLQSDLYRQLQEQKQKLLFSTQEVDTIETFRGLAIKKQAQKKQETIHVDTSFGHYLDAIYEANGSMQKHMDHYEKRSGQREMSETVYDAFQSQNHALVEAETGTGKTLAYLLPAIYEAVSKRKRILVSTYTTQLQSQLLDDEIPLIRRLVPFPFRVALLKGRQHYISLEKFERALAYEQDDNYDIILTKAMILVWLTETETGDIDEIQLPSSGYLFFKQVSSDMEGALDPSSPDFFRSYYLRARKSAQQADILITNHALLCTDMANDYQLLPTYEKAVIDEAHHFEETAAKHFGAALDYVCSQNILNQVGITSENSWLGRLLADNPEFLEVFRAEKWNAMFTNAKQETDDLFRMLFQYVLEQRQKDKSLSDIGRLQYRFDGEKEGSRQWNTVIEMAARLTYYIRDLIHLLSPLTQLKTIEADLEEELNKHIEDLQSIINRLERLFLTKESSQEVKWIEIEAHGAKNAVYLYCEPVAMAPLLQDGFFQQKESIILTSATLTMRNSFTFMQNRLGLPGEKVMTAKIKSPFSYENQVQLMVPDDFPDIKYGRLDDFVEAVSEAIISMAHITDGRMLVLFTSYDMLKKAYYLLKETIDVNQYMLIAQGISSGSRSRLKKNFQTFDNSILLGTSSFWEGVDIPGEDLSCVMIARLPFQPPNHPVYEAKSNYLQETGKNPFIELALPDAVIRFKQGFGRLIRSAKDRGIVFVCDNRIKKARYGNYFLDSIPGVPVTFDSTQAILEKAEEWF
ncbi:ATP-dependent DNA helicase DinG [Lentibacillus cibarius]|uniref:3'-5' exonuclease DinG n=1 Tax=Lentibacillus cibarius TaxID=2583219 RepID=A0A549YL05_9BACI|nr:ATP-dependent DNA helicase DinG [Lentibacillus cibarius]TRM12553.1 ATP-dependent DNA helicase DinG [Lentibacillus cibarius]